ncbi:hypothetical protein E2562_027043 [Oryza meyeriana var. granulata]|uniref:Uncharacterized protein n=1 Tax=Oryza meyeriana var. granulata TaxID=110450 RepID=A0A6G1C891_9ORYZ|nr:hypothetical protein E2562_027043 [Oryza meyeriana var. granulata]
MTMTATVAGGENLQRCARPPSTNTMFCYPPWIHAPGELRNSLFSKAVVSCDPSRGNYFVALIHNPHAQL